MARGRDPARPCLPSVILFLLGASRSSSLAASATTQEARPVPDLGRDLARGVWGPSSDRSEIKNRHVHEWLHKPSSESVFTKRRSDSLIAWDPSRKGKGGVTNAGLQS
ncbi:Protocadherin Beta-14 [Manis pentadactyla]|nr:Protocadherin Beta-14 [Manis pentadactyla]